MIGGATSVDTRGQVNSKSSMGLKKVSLGTVALWAMFGASVLGQYNTYTRNTYSAGSPSMHTTYTSSSNNPGSFSSYRTQSNNPQYQFSSSSQQPSSGQQSGSVHRSSSYTSSSSRHTSRSFASTSRSSGVDPLQGLRIVCIFNNKHYYKNGFRPANIDPTLCTHINYEFAILDPKTHEMIIGDTALDVQENFIQEAIDLRKSNPNLKVIISLGGWDDSTKKYSELAADKEKRANFVAKAVPFIKSHEFDGMDFAWEYPNCWQGALGVNPNDKGNFISLLQELKSEFDKNGLILSVSVGTIKREVEAAYDGRALSKTVHYINVMAYDLHGPWESQTGHHMQFMSKPGDSDPYCNVKKAIELWSRNVVDKKQLNLGMAFYAKTFTLADPQNWVMGAPARGVGDPGPDSDEGGFLLYNEICQWLNAGNWTESEDKQAGFFAHSGDQWACYDPPMMVVRKAKYLVDEGLGGVLLKDLGGDDYKGLCFSMPYPLTKMIRLEMIQKIKRKNRHV